jgi:hypothetical protein
MCNSRETIPLLFKNTPTSDINFDFQCYGARVRAQKIRIIFVQSESQEVGVEIRVLIMLP